MARVPELPPRLQSAVVHRLMSLAPGTLRRIVGRPVVIDGQTLNVEVQILLRLLELSGEAEVENPTVAESRSRMVQLADVLRAGKPASVTVADLSVDGAAGSLRGRLYAPEPVAGRPRLGHGEGLLVYFHGGGFVAGDLNTHDGVCRFLAHEAEARILSVDYRRAPEAGFPAAFDDALAAFGYAVQHARDLGANPARVAVGGDSAGGNLAAGVAREAAGDSSGGPVFQLLLYPWLDLSSKRPSHRLFRAGFYLSDADLDWYKAHYLTNLEDAGDPRCSPLLAPSLGAVAPAYIATAGFDPLRDEGEEYATRLESAGVPVALRRHSGQMHGFANLTGAGHAGSEAMLQAAGALRTGLAWAARGSK